MVVTIAPPAPPEPDALEPDAEEPTVVVPLAVVAVTVDAPLEPEAPLRASDFRVRTRDCLGEGQTHQSRRSCRL